MASASYFFVFGRTPQLASSELRTLFPNLTLLTDEVAQVAIPGEGDVGSLINTLGGTIKIAKPVAVASELTVQSLLPYIDIKGGHVTFGCSFYGFDVAPKTLASDMKRELDKQGIKARYVTAEHGSTLSSVVVDKGRVEEFVIVKIDREYHIGKTLAVQPYEAWNKRDYGRPFADAKSGMLPPKVARMIVNIGAGQLYGSSKKQLTLLDPFCGMGTIPAEAYMIGVRVIGSDTDVNIVRKAQKNLEWLTATYPQTGGVVEPVTLADAVHASANHAAASVDFIATEPYMGTTSVANTQQVDLMRVKNTIKGLEKLYIGCLRDWHKILLSKGRVVIALPAYAISGRIYFVKKVVDMCENLGYTIVDGPIEYSRPQAIVKRMFYILQKST